MTTRRSVLKALAAGALLPACTSSQQRATGTLDNGGAAGSSACGAGTGGSGALAATGGDQLIFLGTQGGPRFTLSRGETACALVVNGQTYVLDCGYGALRGLMQAQLDILKIGQFFLTHLHVDHTADLAAILGLQWTQGRKDPTTVYGPYGTDALVAGALAFNAADARIRTADEGRTLLPESLFKGVVGPATSTPTKVYEDGNIVVTSIENTHYSDAVKAAIADRSLAYRVDSASRKVVFSGDTAPTDALVQLAQGADILVCEAIDVVATRASFDAQVAMGAYGDNPEGVWNHIVSAHTSLADAGRMAAAANVKTLVLYHLVPGGLGGGQPDSSYIEQVTPTFSGKVIVAADQLIV